MAPLRNFLGTKGGNLWLPAIKDVVKTDGGIAVTY